MEGSFARQTSSFPPKFDKDLEIAPYLARVPDDVCCKGMFFNDIMTAVRNASPEAERRLQPKMSRRRYLPFRDYPLREHMELTADAVKLLFPGIPSREGMRRLGWLAYPTFVNSMVGRVVFGILGKDLDRIFEVGPRSFEVSLSHGRAVATRVNDRAWRYDFADIYGFLDSYYVGVIEGPIRHHGFTPEVRIQLHSLSDGVMDIRWE